MSFGKSRARLMNENTRKVTFSDVAGIEEVKEEVAEIIDFLKDPKNSPAWAVVSPKASCWSARREPAKPSWPEPLPVKPGYPSSVSAALTS